jgi:hypothetical protein
MSTTAFPVNPTLTAVAIGYQNPESGLIADRVLPRIPTGKKFNWTKYDAAQGFTVPNTLVGRKSEPTVVDFGGTPQNDEVADYGLDDIIPNDEIEAFDAMPKPSSGGPISPETLSTMMLTGLVQLDREIRVASMVFNNASYGAANKVTLVGNAQWSDKVNSDPADAILAAMDSTLVRPNKFAMGRQVATKLRQHPKIVQGVFGSAQTSGIVSMQQLRDYLELDEILVGASFVNTARKGQPANYVRVWGKSALLFYSNTLAAQTMQPTFGFTAQFGDRVAGSMDEPKMGLSGSKRVRSGEKVKEVLSATDCAFYFDQAIA